MTDHKFEPFQQVLVRDTDAQNWTGLLYSHRIGDVHMCGDMSWKQCIPYTPETAHLLGTSQPYEPPVDEAERFNTGEIVEVCSQVFSWHEAIYLKFVNHKQHKVYDFKGDFVCTVQPDRIRPLPDSSTFSLNAGGSYDQATYASRRTARVG